MQMPAVLAFSIVASCVLKCYVSAGFVHPGEAKHSNRNLDFPLEPNEDVDDDEGDGMVENIEEAVDVPMEDFETSREFPKPNSEILDRVALKEVLDKPRKLYENPPRAPERGSVAYIKVVAISGNGHRVYGDPGQSPRRGKNPQLVIVLNNGMKHRADMKYDRSPGQRYEIELNVRSDFTPTLICTHKDIKEAYLEAGGNHGWYVASINTYTAGTNKMYTKLTTDPGFSMWVDAIREHRYPYNAKKHLLTNAVAGYCITYVRVDAKTGKKYGAGFSKSRHTKNPLIVLILSNKEKLQAELEGSMVQGGSYMRELHFASRFHTRECVSLSDLKEVHLQTQHEVTDGWYIASIRTSAKAGDKQYEDVTNDPHLNKKLDADEDIELTCLDQEILNCEYGNSSCECSASAKVCIINLEIDEIRTFTSYQKLSVDEPTGLALRGTEGVIYYFADNGTSLPLQTNRACSTQNPTECTNPQFVDGKTYRLAIAVNGQIPGPTLIVHEGQTVRIHVHNNLTTEGISIHWHGMHQKGSPWMDGVGQVTQCQIGPSSSFTYHYTARPSGTFWYHSHSGAQRTDGFFGALIVRESQERMLHIRSKLPDMHSAFKDFPDRHTLTLLDWQHEASLDLFTQIQGSVGFYPNKSSGEVPTPDDEQYVTTRSSEEGRVGPIPYFSGIINGKGRHADVPYHKTKLSIFTVEAGNSYRFRLVGAQGLYAYKFSIDGHKLTVVGTDGYWIEPEEEVDYIIIHTGERYDFLLKADQTLRKDYWIRAETLEIDSSGTGPPYHSLGHVAEAILHYQQDGDSVDPYDNVPSTKYQEVKDNSPPIQCDCKNPCKAVNCPFQHFHQSYHIDCVNVESLRLLEATPLDELPIANPKGPMECPNCRHFINFNFEGDSDTSSVNGRNLIMPSFPPQTQTEEFWKKDTICNLTSDCNPSTPECSCVFVITIPHNETIQLVFSAIGAVNNAHPIHLHGHTFHVVKVGYPEYHQSTGFIKNHNSDISCDDINCTKEGCNPMKCTRPSWTTDSMNFSIDSYTIRKDTVMLPAGGYVVINFLSDNPGYWFLHCHIEIHQLQGMALIVSEAPSVRLQPPEGMNKCGDFDMSVNN
ncbi:uncharacterized protein [Montipora capricornis]|uniref:uncharacterized protein n=1 Tax=Montipora capricornis TaxID=246305 RepID=UPI0035F216DF